MLEKESLYTVNYYPCKNPIRLQRNSMIQWIRIRILTLSTSYVKTYRWQQTHEQMLSSFSCASWPSECLLWRNVYLGLLPIFGLGCFFDIELHVLLVKFGD